MLERRRLKQLDIKFREEFLGSDGSTETPGNLKLSTNSQTQRKALSTMRTSRFPKGRNDFVQIE